MYFLVSLLLDQFAKIVFSGNLWKSSLEDVLKTQIVYIDIYIHMEIPRILYVKAGVI